MLLSPLNPFVCFRSSVWGPPRASIFLNTSSVPSQGQVAPYPHIVSLLKRRYPRPPPHYGDVTWRNYSTQMKLYNREECTRAAAKPWDQRAPDPHFIQSFPSRTNGSRINRTWHGVTPPHPLPPESWAFGSQASNQQCGSMIVAYHNTAPLFSKQQHSRTMHQRKRFKWPKQTSTP